MINFTFLKYFYDAAKHSSILKSAQDNFVSPAAVSGAIKKIEETYQIQLIEHKRKVFDLTPNGRHFYEKLPSLLESIAKFENSILEDQAKVKGEIKLVTTQSLANSILPVILQKINTQYPDLIISVKIAPPAEIIALVKSKSANLGLTIERIPITNLKTIPLHKGKFCIVKSKSCKTKHLAVTKYWEEVVQFERLYKNKFGETCPIYFRAPNWSVVKEFVEKGICPGLLPDYLVSPHLQKLYTKIQLKDYKISLLYEKELRIIDEAFVSLIKNSSNLLHSI